MKNLLLTICSLFFMACGSSDLSGVYVCRDVKFSSQTMSPQEISENQNAAQEDLLGTIVTVRQYSETVWIGFSDGDGNHFKKQSNTEYVFLENNGDSVIAKFSGNTLTLKEYDNRYSIEITCIKR